MIRRYLFGSFLLLYASICSGDPADSIVLLQPDQVIGQRLIGDAKMLANFITATMKILEKVVPEAEIRSKAAFVVAFGPGYHSQGWIIGDDITATQQKQFNTKLQDLQTPELKEGFVAFEVLGKNSQAAKNQGTKDFAPPVPEEWREAVKKAGGVPMHTDQVLEKLLIKKAQPGAAANSHP